MKTSGRALGAAIAVLWAAGAARAADAKIEEQVVGPVGQDVKYVVSPRGGHLAAVARKGSRINVIVDGVTYLDGKPIIRCDRVDSGPPAQMYGTSSSSPFMKTPPAWDVGSDGVLTMLAPVGDEIKRYRVTPSPDTSIAMVMADAQAAATKAKASPEQANRTVKR